MTHPQLKSLKSGTFSIDDAVALSGRAKTDYVASMFAKIPAKMNGGYDVDVLYASESVTIEGDFKNFWNGTNGYVFLFVAGDLVVHGVFQDFGGEPETIVVVEGDLKAKNLVTAGFLEVHGNVDVEETIAGLYNDCCANIFGHLNARVLHTGEHHFEVGGVAKAEFAYSPRIKVSNTLPTMSDEEWAAKLDPELFDGGEDEDGWWLDYIDEGEVAARVADGGSIFK